MAKQKLMSVTEAATYLGVTRDAIYKAWKSGKFPTSSKIGNIYLITFADIEAYKMRREAKKEEVE